jgi:hypothetical protein
MTQCAGEEVHLLSAESGSVSQEIGAKAARNKF